MVAFQFQGRRSFGTYVLPIKPKEDTPAHNKKAESERSELSLSKEEGESERSELSLSQLRVLLSSAKKTNLHTRREQSSNLQI